MIVNAEEKRGQRGLLRLVEEENKGFAARDHNRCSIIQHVYEVQDTRHEPAEKHHEDGEFAVHSLEQFVERQRGKKAPEAGDQIADDAEAEEQFVGGNFVDGSDCIVANYKSTANVNGPNDREARQQVKESGDSAWVVA